MFNALKFMACIFKWHIVNPDESLVRDYMLDERNWLCKCHRCGIYIMHDGAMSGLSVMMFEHEAKDTALEFNRQFMNLHKSETHHENATHATHSGRNLGDEEETE